MLVANFWCWCQALYVGDVSGDVTCDVTLCFYVVGRYDIFISLLQSEEQYKLHFLPFMIFESKMIRLLFFLGET